MKDDKRSVKQFRRPRAWDWLQGTEKRLIIFYNHAIFQPGECGKPFDSSIPKKPSNRFPTEMNKISPNPGPPGLGFFILTGAKELGCRGKTLRLA
jgi:hypothetical protein